MTKKVTPPKQRWENPLNPRQGNKKMESVSKKVRYLSPFNRGHLTERTGHFYTQLSLNLLGILRAHMNIINAIKMYNRVNNRVFRYAAGVSKKKVVKMFTLNRLTHQNAWNAHRLVL